jgi:hypothetical protein
VSLDGSQEATNGSAQLSVFGGAGHTIGGETALDRNVIAGGVEGLGGIYCNRTRQVTIANCNIGVARDGRTPLAAAGVRTAGIRLQETSLLSWQTPQTVYPGEGGVVSKCVIGGVKTGVVLHEAYGVHLKGNMLGLARNGVAAVALKNCGVEVRGGSQKNLIGGETAEDRNLLASMDVGVSFRDASTADNKVQGNYFGLTAAGDAWREIDVGISCGVNAGAQTIGGASAAAGNFICPKATSLPTHGILLWNGGDGSTITHNVIGRRPDGQVVPTRYDRAITLISVGAKVRDNSIYNAKAGVICGSAPAATMILGNAFRQCQDAVHLKGSTRACLGNLGNMPNTDDGGNKFYASNEWYIRNETSATILAEGNRFPVHNEALIRQKVWDKGDKPALGLVDLIPMGQSLPLRIRPVLRQRIQ